MATVATRPERDRGDGGDPSWGRSWRWGRDRGGDHIMADSTHMIKKSIIFRAKYRLERDRDGPTYRVLSPQIVVPHPRNRGGGPVKSLRTEELSGTVVADGCDPLEACSNAVAVQEQTDKVWA